MGMKKDLKFSPVPCGNVMDSVHPARGAGFTPALPQNLSSAGHTLRNPTVRFVPSDRGMIDRAKMNFSPSWVINNISPERSHKRYTLDWWTDTAIFNHNSLLVSAFYGMEEWEFREFYKIPRKDFLFVADSGGWQIASQGAKIDPIDILRWQEHNADIGFTLDVPPVEPGTYVSYVDFEKFKRCVEIAKRNYEIAHRNRKSEDLIIYKVIHGGSVKELDYFANEVKDTEFDGIAYSPKPPVPMGIALQLAYGYNRGDKDVHMFTGTGLNTIPVVVFAKKFYNKLTFDSSSFSVQGARYRSYCNFFYLASGIDFGKGYTSTLKKLPCVCPVCLLATVDDLNKEGSLPGGLIALHNLYITLQYIYILSILADSYEDYIKFLGVYARDQETIKAVSFLQSVYENGFESALKEYGIHGQESAATYFR